MTLKIGLLGFGTVASGLPFLLVENTEKIVSSAQTSLEIAKVLVKDDAEKERLLAQGYSYHFVTDVAEILEDDTISIVVELMGRIEPAKTFITRALEAGKHVVSANKDLIALHGQDLIGLAKDKGVAFYYEAAVAGGIPILRTLANAMAADKVTRLLGVLNGTSNFMLTKMVGEGWTYEQALAEAQALGYAESDPTNDVEGIDAAYKATLLTQFAFGMVLPFDKVSHQGISKITPVDVAMAQDLGYVIKLVGDVRETTSGVLAEVAPTLIPNAHPLATVNGVMNAVFVESIGLGQSMYYGPGAGQKPTAVSVMTDIIRIARRLSEQTVGKAFNDFSREVVMAKPEDVINAYYLAIKVSDGQEDFWRLTTLLANHGIAVQQVFQKALDDCTLVVAMLKDVSQKTLMELTESLSADDKMTVHNIFKVLGEC